MRLPRRGIRRRRRRREAPPEPVRQATERARAEAERLLDGDDRRRRRMGARWAEAVTVRLRGAALETRRRLRPVGRAGSGGLARIAPRISHALFVVLRIPAAVIAVLLDLFLELSAWVRARVGPIAAGIAAVVAAAAAKVTPVRALVAVIVLASIGLAGSQFEDYRGVAVGGDQYSADEARVAPPPLTDLQRTGEAHLFAFVPGALLAIALTWLTARGRWQLGRAIALVGLAGVAVALLVDMPKGLDEGGAGTAYLDTEAQLLGAFWAQLAACATLILCGPLLGWHVRLAAVETRRGGRARGTGLLAGRREPDRDRAALASRPGTLRAGT